MNERSKLLDVIRHCLSFDVEMDYMDVFASFCSSEDSSVRCACELLYYLSIQEYPDLRQEMPVRNLVTDIKASLENGELIDESTLSSKIQNDPELRILFERANQELLAVRWFFYFIVTTWIIIVVVLVLKI
jgi:hypothetical protein